MNEPTLINRQWTEQEVMAAALVCGYTDDEAKLYFLHYDCQDWKRANGQAITKVQTHMQWCKATGNMPSAREEKDNARITMYPLKPPKNCSTDRCNVPAVFKRSGAYDFWYCKKHIPEKDLVDLREQGYDV